MQRGHLSDHRQAPGEERRAQVPGATGVGRAVVVEVPKNRNIFSLAWEKKERKTT